VSAEDGSELRDPNERREALRTALPQPFEVRTAKQDGHWVVAVQGEIDLATVGTLEAYLNDVTGRVVLDLANVTFIDSMGVALLLSATKDGLTIREASPEVRRVFHMCGLDGEIHDNGLNSSE
jgi:anti-anti-sigma factor